MIIRVCDQQRWLNVIYLAALIFAVKITDVKQKLLWKETVNRDNVDWSLSHSQTLHLAGLKFVSICSDALMVKTGRANI